MSITISEGSAASGSLLTTLARIKSRLNISVSTYDARLTQLATAAGMLAEEYCDRTFLEADYIEYPEVRGGIVTLAQWPIQYVTRVATAPTPAIEISFSHATDFGAYIKTTATGVTLTQQPSGTANTLLYASYSTVTLLEAAIEALSGFSSDVVNTMGAFPSAWLTRELGSYSAQDASLGAGNKSVLYLYANEPAFRPLFEDGRLEGRFPMGYGTLEVRYRAGYESAPEDLQEAVAAIAAAMYRRGGRDLALMNEKIGDYSYTQFQPTQVASVDFIDADAKILLRKYRRTTP
jgi:hypothetical protein